MTVEELMNKLSGLIKSGALEPDAEVSFRDYRVSDDAMEAGSNGWVEVEEVLIADGVKLLDGAY